MYLDCWPLFFVVVDLRDCFRTDKIVGASLAQPRDFGRLRPEGRRDAEVDQFQLTFNNQEISRLQVRVNDTCKAKLDPHCKSKKTTQFCRSVHTRGVDCVDRLQHLHPKVTQLNRMELVPPLLQVSGEVSFAFLQDDVQQVLGRLELAKETRIWPGTVHN